jgi:hypothetical protein
MRRLSARDYAAPHQDRDVSSRTLATVQQSSPPELTFARQVSHCPRDPVHVLATDMKRESDYQITGKTLGTKLFSADRTAGVPLPRNVDLQHGFVFCHAT